MVLKKSIVRDKLNFKSTLGGLYAIYPFDNINTNGFGLFKVGMAKESINSRLDHFFNYFPDQFRVISLMEFLRYPDFTEEEKDLYTATTKTDKLSYVRYLLAKEKELQDYLIKRGSTRIYSDGRVRNPQFTVDEDGKKDKVSDRGATEWFYTKEEWIKQWFEDEDKRLNKDLRKEEEVSHIFLRDEEESLVNTLTSTSTPSNTKFVGELAINLKNKPKTQKQRKEEEKEKEKKKQAQKDKAKEYRLRKKLEKQEQEAVAKEQESKEQEAAKKRGWLGRFGWG